MDKDPIREEAEKEVNAKFVKHPMEVDELGRVVDAQSEEKSICNCEIDRCRYIAKQMIEKHLREKAELQEETAALHSHNLELVEALKQIRSTKDMWVSSYALEKSYGIVDKVLSSPPSEKYLRMVRVVKCAEKLRKVDGSSCLYDELKNIEFGEDLDEALKSYNSEKGGEHERV